MFDLNEELKGENNPLLNHYEVALAFFNQFKKVELVKVGKEEYAFEPENLPPDLKTFPFYEIPNQVIKMIVNDSAFFTHSDGYDASSLNWFLTNNTIHTFLEAFQITTFVIHYKNKFYTISNDIPQIIEEFTNANFKDKNFLNLEKLITEGIECTVYVKVKDFTDIINNTKQGNVDYYIHELRKTIHRLDTKEARMNMYYVLFGIHIPKSSSIDKMKEILANRVITTFGIRDVSQAAFLNSVYNNKSSDMTIKEWDKTLIALGLTPPTRDHVKNHLKTH